MLRQVYWDLVAERAKRGVTDTAILAVEQIAPLPTREIAGEIAQYPNAEIVWVQDEPENQGTWPFVALNLPAQLAVLGEKRPLRVVSRPATASPSTGSSKKHAVEQKDLIERSFA